MLYSILADILVVFHLIFILFVMLGGLLLLKWLRVGYLHMAAVAWAILLELYGWICPLTPLEQHYRRLSGETGYSGGFIEHYLLPLIYPAGLTREVQIVLALCVITVNLVIYGIVIVNYRRRRRQQP
ncbi:MAG TPA: DUF2784 domain-containing protein [Gammaproteobacteria bacterium]|nr:DUF2784 domain-containing protein [Gammaproteobacteria bacterium]